MPFIKRVSSHLTMIVSPWVTMTRWRMSRQSSLVNLDSQAPLYLNLHSAASKRITFLRTNRARFELIRTWVTNRALNHKLTEKDNRSAWETVLCPRWIGQVQWMLHQHCGWGRLNSVTQDPACKRTRACLAAQGVIRRHLLIKISLRCFVKSTIQKQPESWLIWRERCMSLHRKILKSNRWSWIKSNRLSWQTSGPSSWKRSC